RAGGLLGLVTAADERGAGRAAKGSEPQEEPSHRRRPFDGGRWDPPRPAYNERRSSSYRTRAAEDPEPAAGPDSPGRVPPGGRGPGAVELGLGRVFVDTPSGNATELSTPAGPLHLAHVRASIDVTTAGTEVYVLAGEVRTDGAAHAGPGERLVISGKGKDARAA